MCSRPLIVDSGPPILVNRGWAYAADGMSVDLSKWHEGDSAVVDGYVDAFVPVRGMVSTVTQPRGVRYLQRDTIEAKLGEAVAPFLVVQRAGSGAGRHARAPASRRTAAARRGIAPELRDPVVRLRGDRAGGRRGGGDAAVASGRA